VLKVTCIVEEPESREGDAEIKREQGPKDRHPHEEDTKVTYISYIRYYFKNKVKLLYQTEHTDETNITVHLCLTLRPKV